VSAEGEVLEEIGGDTNALIASAAADKVITNTYWRPYETHARMEPINATVSVQADRVDVWTPTNTQQNALNIVANQLQRDTREVFPNTVFIGGAYGGGGGGNTAVTRQAADLSNQLGRPVQVIWTREEDITHDKQRSIVMNRFTTVLGEDGLPTAWLSRSAGVENRASSAIADMPYLVPHRRHERTLVEGHIPVATHRAPGTNQNAFMIEQFVDEVALAGGWNPLDWRLKMTEGLPQWQLVLNTIKEKIGGSFPTDLPKGEGMGIAICEDHNSNAGACAWVTVSRRGQLTIEKVLTVVDSGYYINPLNCAEQSEGSVCWELSHALYGGLDLRQGRFVNTNFDTYPMMRMNQMPQAELVLAPLGGEVWGGMGEPSGPVAPAAVANAVFFATGKRVRSTPFKIHDLSWSA
jgi:isoquinoline 1-oxidoreductase beta subunit